MELPVRAHAAGFDVAVDAGHAVEHVEVAVDVDAAVLREDIVSDADLVDAGIVELEGLRSARLLDPGTDTFSLTTLYPEGGRS